MTLFLAYEVLAILRNIWDPIIGLSALKYKKKVTLSCLLCLPLYINLKFRQSMDEPPLND